MSGKQYLKNQLPVILINLLGMLVLALFLIASDNPIQTVLFIFAVWSIVLVLSLLAFYFSRKKYLNKLLNMTEQLEERYLLPEIMQVPERADEQVFYQIMKMAEKSMLERIGEVPSSCPASFSYWTSICFLSRGQICSCGLHNKS